MSSHRSLRMGQAVREVVAKAILFEVADPRVRSVTVLGVEVASDMRNATIIVTIMGTEAEQKLAMKGLRHAAGFLQSKVAARLQTRFTPILAFKLDESVKKSVEISRIIDEAIEADRKPGSAEVDAASGGLEEDEDEDDEDEDDLDEDEEDVDDGDLEDGPGPPPKRKS